MTSRALILPAGRDDWATPPDLWLPLDGLFTFTYDPCAALPGDSKITTTIIERRGGVVCVAPGTLRPEVAVAYGGSVFEDGFEHDWTGFFWCNPPYGKGLGDWVERGWDAVFRDRTADGGVMLLPSYTGAPWFQQFITGPTFEGVWFMPYMGPRLPKYPRRRVKFVGGCVKCEGRGTGGSTTVDCLTCRGSGVSPNAAGFDSVLVVWINEERRSVYLGERSE